MDIDVLAKQDYFMDRSLERMEMNNWIKWTILAALLILAAAALYHFSTVDAQVTTKP